MNLDLNYKIQQTKHILQFLENEHDLDGTWPQPLMRSFAVRSHSTFQQMRTHEHDMRIQHYKRELNILIAEQNHIVTTNKRIKLFNSE
jgi:hypothetical protein